jgi:hypothetical protein
MHSTAPAVYCSCTTRLMNWQPCPCTAQPMHCTVPAMHFAYFAVYCNVLQCTAVHCTVPALHSPYSALSLHYIAPSLNCSCTAQAMLCTVPDLRFNYTAVCCSVLQCTVLFLHCTSHALHCLCTTLHPHSNVPALHCACTVLFLHCTAREKVQRMRGHNGTWWVSSTRPKVLLKFVWNFS